MIQSSLLILEIEYISYSGHRTGRSLLMEDGALAWLIVNSKTASESTRRHMELALCHLAQNGMLNFRSLDFVIPFIISFIIERLV